MVFPATYEECAEVIQQQLFEEFVKDEYARELKEYAKASGYSS